MKVLYLALAIASLAGCSPDPDRQQAPEPVAGESNPDTQHVAFLKLPQTKAEKVLLAEFGPYQIAAFDKSWLAEYSDIKKIQFHPPADIRDDPETVAMMKSDFYRSMYYAKRIKIASGGTLFDFLHDCSKRFDNADSASFGWDKGKPFIGLQYFPVLRAKDTGKEVELDIVWNRKGDTVEANSPFFSTHILEDANFMDEHGVECWPKKQRI